MELKPLGNTGVMVPEIGLGTWKYTGGNAPLQRGIELGAFLIDTAEMYRTEDAVGRAVKGIRDRVFIATKVLGRHLRYDEVLRAAEQSLRLLDIDRIDLYQVHWPNSRVPIQETMRAMQHLVDTGLVRYVGVSNFSVQQLADAQAAMPRHPVVSNQVLYNLQRRNIERDLLPYCQRKRCHRPGLHPAGRWRLGPGPSRLAWESFRIAPCRWTADRPQPAVGHPSRRRWRVRQDSRPGRPELVPLPPQRHRHPQVQQRRPHRGKLRRLRLASHPGPVGTARPRLPRVTPSAQGIRPFTF